MNHTGVVSTGKRLQARTNLESGADTLLVNQIAGKQETCVG